MFAALRPRHALLTAAARSELVGGRRWRSFLAHSPQQIAAGEYIKNEATLPIKELTTLRDVIYLLNKSNKHKVKKSILQQFAVPLKEILQFIYDPHIRMYVTSVGVQRYVEKKPKDEDSIATVEQNSIMTILSELQSREVTGNAAMQRVGAFVQYIEEIENRVKDDRIAQKASLKDTFLRCLDRNLRAGINSTTIHEVFGHRNVAKLPILTAKWPAEVKHGAHSILTSVRGASDFEARPAEEWPNSKEGSFYEALKNKEDEEKRNNPSHPKKKAPSFVPSSAPYGSALGKSVELEASRGIWERGPPGTSDDATSAEENLSSWYMSRKLDGVRCIVRIDVYVKEGVKSPLQFVDIETMSRTERPFTSLNVLKEELKRLLCECPSIVRLIEKLYAQRLARDSAPLETLSFYLDGELCALVPEKEVKEGEGKESQDNFMEDFSEIVGIVRRKSHTIPKPAYFPFDVLTEIEFREWRVQEENLDDHEPFFKRRKRVEDMVGYCQEKNSIIVRKLEQVHITSFAQLEAASKEVIEKKWEGLILRKGDRYVGKRSPSIRKFKHWLDAEYTVIDVQKAVMRLPVDQVYEDREVMASVTIKHNDTEVFVGSGFTVEERIRYGADPSLIIGKDITVQYFGESSSPARANEDDLSLRFPRVRKVWEDGSRDI